MEVLIYPIIISLLTTADQLIKQWVTPLKGRPSVMVVPGLLKLTYTENYGAAFSLFWGKRWPLIALAALLLGGLLIYLLSGKCTDRFVRGGLTLIISGGLGNIIDRARLGYVVDYLDISDWFSYPIFNFADCLVVVGAAGLVIYVFLQERRQKKEQTNAD